MYVQICVHSEMMLTLKIPKDIAGMYQQIILNWLNSIDIETNQN